RLKRIAEIILGPGPVERHALAGQFLEGVAIGANCLLQPRRPALACAERLKRIAEIVLGPGPAERHAVAGQFFERGAIGRDRLCQPRRPALARAECLKRIAEIVLGRCNSPYQHRRRYFVRRYATGTGTTSSTMPSTPASVEVALGPIPNLPKAVRAACRAV